MSIVAFDHVAIPTDQPEEMLRFYRSLGFAAPSAEEWVASGAPGVFYSIRREQDQCARSRFVEGSRVHLEGQARLTGMWRFLLRLEGFDGFAARQARGSRRPDRGRSGRTDSAHATQAGQWAPACTLAIPIGTCSSLSSTRRPDPAGRSSVDRRPCRGLGQQAPQQSRQLPSRVFAGLGQL